MIQSKKAMAEAMNRVFGPGRTLESLTDHPNFRKIKAALNRLIAAAERKDDLAEDEAIRELEALKKVQ